MLKSLQIIGFAILATISLEVPAFCFEEAAKQYANYNVTPTLLRAIAKQESGVNNATIHFNKDGSRDVSLMGINSRHFETLSAYGITEDDLLNDPCLATKVGAWIAARHFMHYGNPTVMNPNKYWEAVGSYNAGFSHTGEVNRSIYAWNIYRQMVKVK